MKHQTVTEKHKLNVPETMTEILDVSDEEGELPQTGIITGKKAKTFWHLDTFLCRKQ